MPGYGVTRSTRMQSNQEKCRHGAGVFHTTDNVLDKLRSSHPAHEGLPLTRPPDLNIADPFGRCIAQMPLSGRATPRDATLSTTVLRGSGG